MNQRTQRLRELDQRYLWHPFTHMKQWLAEQPLVITAAEGMYLIDSDGNRYLDGVSSLWCNVHGHRVPQIDQAIVAQLQKVAHSTMLGLASEPGILLAQRLVELAPRSLAKVFYSDSGATATEIAIKMAVQYWHNLGRPQKCELVGLRSAYHGDTVGAMSVGRMPEFHRPHFPLLFKAHFAAAPYVYRSDWPEDPAAVVRHCLAEMEAILSRHAQSIAAVMVEPMVQGAAGMIVHPPGFLRGVAELAKKYDVLLICDEVATGFGRTGRMFACEHEQVEPDLMCMAKGISGGYLPLAATLASQRVFDGFLGEPWEGKTFFHGHTYTGNPLACAAGLASLDLFARNDLLAEVRRKADKLGQMLIELAALPVVGDVRQCGLMVGIELVADKSSRRPLDPRRRSGAAVCSAMRRRGVILRPLGDVIVLMPPLAMGLDDLATIVESLRSELGLLAISRDK